ncbi:succinate-semialdehyde dehydrogenase/glutarate-semialdehyde dehydrogenase [Caulobacter ginsengisoli]|uniref:Succinate-semialdehyde dehydrogenase/glutarate-semialdehyde dehydrogenase n=1 Tax=Caulobacter ginsengisoli TaxID=400775 RepID=A0ABU0IRI7_9CAUL|nr:NAD-dependent succinate-semialdehyde dehydrogenase [Caulobacter ginsengisoli]MDQ0463547.1 succinate-semialdehyde dehydrogenase/glutarate-semialdehyde dehydrogenase [Caulobacter ginsengisoli]
MTRPSFTPVNPATGEARQPVQGHSRQEALDIAAAAAKAQQAWRGTGFAHRAALMKTAAQVLRRRKDELAALMTAEMGKTLTDGRAEVEKCAFNCDHFAEHAEAYLAREDVDLSDAHGPGPKAFVTFNPLGVVLAVMPWNFPFWQVFRFAAPTLMAGNGAVLKHASNVPGCALAIESVFHEAGFPKDLFRTLLIPSGDVGALIASPAIAAVTLTGSVAAGRSVASQAGQSLKKSVLELGGSDAYVILEDADIALAAKVCAAARMVNAGQSCVAGKRFIVVDQIAQAFETALVEAMSAWTPADPTDATTKLGPLVSLAARDEIHHQVRQSRDKGARLLLGGVIPDQPGAWYPPTVLAGVAPGQPAHDQEIFGPVAAVIRARDEADAIRIANDSPYGLGSGVITSDLARGERIAAEALDAGMAFVNKNVASDPRLPFGGVKDSGNGRECGRYGILEFVNVKTVVVG